jgi:hypothetical protein
MNREIRRRDGFSRGVHPEESSPSTTTTTTTTARAAALGTGTGTGARRDGIESSPASVPVDGSFVGSFVRSFVGIVRDDGFDAVRWFKRTNVAFAFVG